MIIEYFGKKRRVSGQIILCFEMLHLHALKRRKERGIDVLNAEKARGFYQLYGAIKLKKEAFEILRWRALNARAFRFCSYLVKRRFFQAVWKA